MPVARLFLLIAAVDLLIGLSPLLLGATPVDLALHHSPLTLLAVAQLVATACFAWLTFGRRRAAAAEIRAPFAWALIGAGFLYAASSDLFQIDERLDRFIHAVFAIQRTGLTDRIDDIIVALYGVLAVAIVLRFRAEVTRAPGVGPLLGAAFGLAFVMLLLDTLTNHSDFLKLFISERGPRARLREWIWLVEEVFKLLAAGAFMVACYASWRAAHLDSPEGGLL